MKKKFLLIIFFILSCSNENRQNEEKSIQAKEVEKNMKEEKHAKYTTLDDFNKRYTYWDEVYNYGVENFGEDTYYIYSSEDNQILNKYIRKKEKNFEKIKTGLFKELKDEEKVKQLLKMLVEVQKEETSWAGTNLELYKYLKKEIDEYNNKLPKDKVSTQGVMNYKKDFLKLLEENFNKEDIEVILERLTIEIEHLNYDVSGRYGLPKVDEIISKLEKVEGLTSEEWAEQEGKSYKPIFENEFKAISSLVFLLKDNRIIVTDIGLKPIKEIKVKDYEETEITVYKGILYVYDDGKIYEYSFKNFDDVNIIDVKNLKL